MTEITWTRAQQDHITEWEVKERTAQGRDSTRFDSIRFMYSSQIGERKGTVFGESFGFRWSGLPFVFIDVQVYGTMTSCISLASW